MRAAYAAEDAGEFDRALALVNGALDELDPERNSRERIEALIVQARNKFSTMGSGGVEALREALRILPEDADAKLRARVLEMLARRTMLSGDPQRGIEFSQQAVDAAALDQLRLGHGERMDHAGHQSGCRWSRGGGPRRIRAGESRLRAPAHVRCCASTSTIPMRSITSAGTRTRQARL